MWAVDRSERLLKFGRSDANHNRVNSWQRARGDPTTRSARPLKVERNTGVSVSPQSRALRNTLEYFRCIGRRGESVVFSALGHTFAQAQGSAFVQVFA